jgi:hypothetical protein
MLQKQEQAPKCGSNEEGRKNVVQNMDAPFKPVGNVIRYTAFQRKIMEIPLSDITVSTSTTIGEMNGHQGPGIGPGCVMARRGVEQTAARGLNPAR